MGPLGMLLIYRLNKTGYATSMLGVLFVAEDQRRVCWFGAPVELDDPVEFVGEVSESRDGTRLGLLDVAQSFSPVVPVLCGDSS